MMFAVLVVLVFLVGDFGSLAATEWKFVVANNDGTRIPVAVALNRRSMLTIPDEVHNDKRCIKRTINQHDFREGLVAMKDPAKRSCWVKPLGKRETYENIKELLDGGNEIIQTNEHWIVPRRSLPKEQLEREIGTMLTDFCSDAEVYMLKRGKLTPDGTDKKYVKCFMTAPPITVPDEFDAYCVENIAGHQSKQMADDCQSFCFNCSIEGHREPGSNNQQ